jgi:hypothetical protein
VHYGRRASLGELHLAQIASEGVAVAAQRADEGNRPRVKRTAMGYAVAFDARWLAAFNKADPSLAATSGGRCRSTAALLVYWRAACSFASPASLVFGVQRVMRLFRRDTLLIARQRRLQPHRYSG